MLWGQEKSGFWRDLEETPGVPYLDAISEPGSLRS